MVFSCVWVWVGVGVWVLVGGFGWVGVFSPWHYLQAVTGTFFFNALCLIAVDLE